MMSADDLVATIRNGPAGCRIGAFFDYTALLQRPAVDETWAGQTEEELRQLGRHRFSQERAGGLYHGAWRLVRAHQNHGHTVVLVASEPRFAAEPLALELGIDHILCTEAKLAAVREFATREGISLRDSHAYAHGDDDIPLLNAVGFPHPVNPTSALAQYSRQKHWTALEFDARRSRRDPMPILRTTAMFGSLLAAGGAGIAAGVISQNRRRGVDFATWLFGRAATSLGNIKIEATGAEHLWSLRPAVFFANHQSTFIDVLATARILERGFTIFAKSEVRAMPVVGTLFELADVAFVDRADTAKAISALQPAVDKLRSGTSIAMSPEGTRSRSPKVGAFKKGGFHLARDAGVPIVIRNAGEIMWRNAMIAQSGTVQVAVHEPLPTVAGPARTSSPGGPRSGSCISTPLTTGLVSRRASDGPRRSPTRRRAVDGGISPSGHEDLPFGV